MLLAALTRFHIGATITRMDAGTRKPADDATRREWPEPLVNADGVPIYEQEFFLALAARGKNAWNRWRSQHRNVAVTFEGIDFTDAANADINFCGYVFGNNCNFSGTIFGNGPWHFEPFVPGMPNFRQSQFGDDATFAGAFFGDRAFFLESVFGDRADFRAATFGDFSLAAVAKFKGSADFSGAIFGPQVKFSETTFRGPVRMDAWSLQQWREFKQALISASSRMSSWTDQKKEKYLSVSENLAKHGIGPDTFTAIHFSSARFLGQAIFLERRFGRYTSYFKNTRFDQPPSFAGCSGTSSVDLFGARIRFSGDLLGIPVPGWTTKTGVMLELRELRKIAEETRNHDLERDLFIEERKAQRGIALSDGAFKMLDRSAPSTLWVAKSRYVNGSIHALLVFPLKLIALFPLSLLRFAGKLLEIAVMTSFWVLGNYGRSFVRPLAALIFSVFVFQSIYMAMLMPVRHSSGNFFQAGLSLVKNYAAAAVSDDSKLGNAIRALAIANAIPLVGALGLEKEVKATVLCADTRNDLHSNRTEPCSFIPRPMLQLAMLAQSIFSGLCLFLIGLALRNYFRLK
jgi:uncharacterized protein YjbI with pentapeptide repeats